MNDDGENLNEIIGWRTYIARQYVTATRDSMSKRHLLWLKITDFQRVELISVVG